MPRPQHHGRPGTRVIPTNWETEHAQVVEGTFTATVSIWEPNASAVTSVNDDLTVTVTEADPIATAVPARIQALKAEDTRALVGDQEQITNGYLVAIGRDLDIPVKAIVLVVTATDTDFVGRRMRVHKLDHGSLRFERDLYCTEDLTETN